MAKEELPDYDFDTNAGFDFDMSGLEDSIEGGVDPEVRKKSRNPVSSALSGVAAGVGDKATDPSFIKNLALKALPKEYQSGTEAVSALAGGVDEIGGAIRKEVAPVARSMTKQLDKLVPESMKRSKKMLGWMKGFLGIDDGNKSYGSSREQDEEDAIQRSLSELFDKQLKLTQVQQVEGDSRAAIQDVKDRNRHKQNVNLQQQQADSLSRLIAINEQIGTPFQRKSLELQYRSLYAQKQLLEKSVEYFTKADINLAAITKNTALPEYQKLTMGERTMEGLFKGIGDSTFGSLFGNNAFLGRAKNNLVKKAKGAISDFSFGLEQGLGFVDSINQSRDMMREFQSMGMDIDGTSEMSKTGTGELMNFAGNKIAGKIRGAIKDDSGVGRLGMRVGEGSAGLQGKVDRLRSADAIQDKEGDAAWKSFMKGVVREVLDAPFATSGMEVTGLRNLQPDFPVNWDFASRQSLVTIIPGYFARTLQELQMMRTGNDKIGLTVFDAKSATFKSNSAVKRGVQEKLEDSVNREGYQRSAEDVVKLLVGESSDPALAKKLTQMVKESGFAADHKRGGLFDKASFESETFLGKLNSDERMAFTTAMEAQFADDTSGRKKMVLAQQLGRVRGGVKDTRSVVNQMIKDGYGDQLESLGVIKRVGDQQYLDFEKQVGFTTGKNERYGETFEDDALASGIRDNGGGGRSPSPRPRGNDSSVKQLERTLRELIATLKEQAKTAKNARTGTKETTQPSSIPDACCDRIVDAITEQKKPLETMVEHLSVIRDKVGSTGVINVEQFAELKTLFSGLGEKISSLGNLGVSDRLNEALYNLDATMRQMYEQGAFETNWQTAKRWGKGAAGIAGRGAMLGGIAASATARFTLDQSIKGGKRMRDVITGPVAEFGKSSSTLLGNMTGDTLEWLNDRFLSKEEREKKAQEQKDNPSEKDNSPSGILRRIRDQAFSLVGNSYTSVSEGIKTLFNDKLPKGWGVVAGLFKKGFDKGVDWINRPKDLYIPSRGWEQPVLRAAIMRIGGYANALDGSPIKTLKDIQGPVKDVQSGELLVTMEEFGEGLYTIDRKKIGGTLKNLKSLAGNLFMPGLRKAGKIIGRYNPLKVPDGLRKEYDRVKGIITDKDDPEQWKQYHTKGPDEGGEGCCTRQVTVLEEIRDILKGQKTGINTMEAESSQPSVKKRVAGQFHRANASVNKALDKATDRAERFKKDAVTKGSELLDKTQAKFNPDLAENGVNAADTNTQRWLAKIFLALSKGQKKENHWADTDGDGERQGGSFSRLKSLFSRKKKKEEEAEGKAKAGTGEKKEGLFDGWGGPAVVAALAAGGAWNWAEDAGKRVFGKTDPEKPPLPIANTGGFYSTTPVAPGAPIPGTEPSGFAAKFGFLSDSVMAVPYKIGSSISDKLVGKLQANNASELTKLRLMQYGFGPEHEAHFHKLFALEELMVKTVGYVDNKAEFLNGKIDITNIFKVLDIAEDDRESISRAVAWLDSRFKPVYLTYRNALHTFKQKKLLHEIDGLPNADKLKLLDLVAFDRGPYHITVSPIKAIPALKSNAGTVRESVDALRKLLATNTPPDEEGGFFSGLAGFAKDAGEKLFGKKDTGAATVEMGAPPETAEIPRFVRADEKPRAGGSGDFMLGGLSGTSMIPGGADPSAPMTPTPVATAVANQGSTTQTSSTGLMPPPPTGPFNPGMTSGANTTASGGDPSGGEAFMQPTSSSVHINQVNPVFLDRLKAAAKKYHAATGKKLIVKDAFRSYEEQVAIKKRHPTKAADPGNSPHEFGFAIDADSDQLDEMDRLGILKAEGLTRPVGGERWHVEPAGVQRDLPGAKRDKALLEKMIKDGIGRGGKGYGSIPGTPLRKRNATMALALLNEGPPLVDDSVGPLTKAPEPPAPAVAAAPTGFYDYGQDRDKPKATGNAPQEQAPAGFSATVNDPGSRSLPGNQETSSAGNLEQMPVSQAKSLPYHHPALDAYATKMEKKYGLPPGLLVAIKNAGERTDSWKTSPAGAKGVMQLMPRNIAKFGVKDPENPIDSIEGAAKYFQVTTGQYDGDVYAMIADYNGGPKQAKPVRAGGVPIARETANYLKRVSAYLKRPHSPGKTLPSEALGRTEVASAKVEPNAATVKTAITEPSGMMQASYSPPIAQEVQSSTQSPSYPVAGSMGNQVESLLGNQLSVLEEIRDILKGQATKVSPSTPIQSNPSVSNLIKTAKDARDQPPSDNVSPIAPTNPNAPTPRPIIRNQSVPSIKRGLTA